MMNLQHAVKSRFVQREQVTEAPDPNPPHSMDGKCLAEHCLGAVASCMINSDCRKALECTNGCGNPPTNQTCIFQCQSDFENEVYDGLIKCVMQDHDCEHYSNNYTRFSKCASVDKAAPLTHYRGAPLTSAVASKLLEKNWVVARGKSKAYDCFDCQYLYWIARPDGDMNYVANYKIHKTNGHIRWNTCVYTAKDWEASPGRFHLNTTNYGGLTHIEDWRLLAADEREPAQWIAMYYCGDAEAVGEGYEGAFVLTPDGTYPTDQESLAAIEAVYTKAGQVLQCYPDNSNCAGNPGVPHIPNMEQALVV